MKIQRTVCFRREPSYCIRRHRKMAVCVFWLLGKLQILRNDLDMILLSPEKYKRNLLVKKLRFLYSCVYVPPRTPTPLENPTSMLNVTSATLSSTVVLFAAAVSSTDLYKYSSRCRTSYSPRIISCSHR